MDAVDDSAHYEVTTAEETPSILSIVIDTNPRAWAALNSALPLSAAIANLLVYVNARMAFTGADQVAVIAAHVNRAVWLHPTPPRHQQVSGSAAAAAAAITSGEAQMSDAPPSPDVSQSSANRDTQLAQIESAVITSIRKLMDETVEEDLVRTTTQLSGALTLALCHINKASQALSGPSGNLTQDVQSSTAALQSLKGRILVLSVSDSEPSQYIPTMNAVFAAAHAQVAIDTLALSGDSTFLQQACFNTNGTFLAPSTPQGLLTYLMFGLAADTEACSSVITPTNDTIDFRAACFCHGKVVDTGFVCSICLSIFCDVPDDSECLTCSTKLALGNYGSKPAVVPRRKVKKRKRIANGTTAQEETGSATATPLR